MKRIATITLIVLALALIASGCSTTFTTGNGKLAYGEISGAEKGELDVTENYIYLMHPDIMTFGGKTWETLDGVIEPELEAMGANAVKDVAITNGTTVLDMILTSLTGGALGFGYYQVTGTAVQQ